MCVHMCILWWKHINNQDTPKYPQKVLVECLTYPCKGPLLSCICVCVSDANWPAFESLQQVVEK